MKWPLKVLQCTMYVVLDEKQKKNATYSKINNPLLTQMTYCHVILDFKQPRTDVSEFVLRELCICLSFLEEWFRDAWRPIHFHL